jgi:Rnl2 family RNA ligase
MQFRKYSTIENTYLTSFLDKIKTEGYDQMEYVVQEKIHGSNVCIITDGKVIQFAKRTEIIEDEASFFRINQLREKYSDKIFSLYRSLKQEFEINSLSIFGEYFGGYYPHINVKKDLLAKTVQKGVYYLPNNEFYAFDILLNGHVYLDVDTCNRLFHEFGFVYAESLFRGNLQESVNYQNDFQSTIPDKFKLPIIEDNACEGVIIRPIKPLFLSNGSRVLLKNKNEKWTEISKRTDKHRTPKIQRENKTLSNECSVLIVELETYITLNRLQNIQSKLGIIDIQKDFGKLMGLYSTDVLEEFLKMNESNYVGLDKSEQKIITKELTAMVKAFLKSIAK